MNILETKGLYHDFGGLKVLFDVNLEVREGERLAVIGPNGAGKTTLFNVITGAYQPSQGRVYFKGRETTGFPPHRLVRRGISDHQHLFQADGLSEHPLGNPFQKRDSFQYVQFSGQNGKCYPGNR